MGGGNAAKAMTRRGRIKEKAGGTKPQKSQLKVNEAAKSIQCKVCLATFLSTTREKGLSEHAVNKHNKTVAECFPGVEIKRV